AAEELGAEHAGAQRDAVAAMVGSWQTLEAAGGDPDHPRMIAAAAAAMDATLRCYRNGLEPARRLRGRLVEAIGQSGGRSRPPPGEEEASPSGVRIGASRTDPVYVRGHKKPPLSRARYEV